MAESVQENSSKRLLVIGFGSIGGRHARLANDLGWKVAVVSRRGKTADMEFACYADIASALRDFAPAFVIVATETGQHIKDIAELADCGFDQSLLVEKPITSNLTDGPIPDRFSYIYCAYVLRFHPVMTALKKALQSDSSAIRYISAHCGQHLSDWRSGRDSKDSYSAQAEKGGGVLRDLSHEIDSVLWLTGKQPNAVMAVGGNLGVLGIQADECWSILIRFEGVETLHCTIGINYYERPAQRHISIVTLDHQYYADFIRGTVTVDGNTVAVFSGGRDAIYLDQLAALEINDKRLCTLDEAMLTMEVIDMAERSQANGNWIVR